MSQHVDLSLRVDHLVKQLIDVTSRHSQHRSAFVDQAFADHIDGDLHGCGTGALAVPCLKHPELAALDRELEILHVFVVSFETVRDFHKLIVDFGHVLLQLVDVLGRADAGDHVFALRVYEVIAE